MKYMMVPVEDIEKLEEARKMLFQLTEAFKISYTLIESISRPMWIIANTKWQVTEGPKMREYALVVKNEKGEFKKYIFYIDGENDDPNHPRTLADKFIEEGERFYFLCPANSAMIESLAPGLK